jgi:HNH endonuclease
VAGGHRDATFEQRCADALIGLGKAKPGGSSGGGKTVVLLSVKLETLQAELVGHGPIGLDELSECLARADVYAAITDMNDVPIRFGRSKRLATAMQKLLLAASGGGTCSYPGCDRHWTQTKVHHVMRFEEGGLTDIENLALLCDQHHRHHHLVDEPGIDRALRIMVGISLGRGPPWERPGSQ